MNKCAFFFLTSFTLLSFAMNASNHVMEGSPKIKISIGSQVFYATLRANLTTASLIKTFPLTLTMIELNGNEKYAKLKQALPTQEESVGKIQSGDLLLYGNDVLVLFYESFVTPYSYTRIGRLNATDGFQKALGSGNCQLKIELDHER